MCRELNAEFEQRADEIEVEKNNKKLEKKETHVILDFVVGVIFALISGVAYSYIFMYNGGAFRAKLETHYNVSRWNSIICYWPMFGKIKKNYRSLCFNKNK